MLYIYLWFKAQSDTEKSKLLKWTWKRIKPQKHSHKYGGSRKYQNLWICFAIWQGGIKVIDGINVAKQLILNRRLSWIICMDPIIRVIINKRGKYKSLRWSDTMRERLNQPLLALKIEGDYDSNLRSSRIKG